MISPEERLKAFQAENNIFTKGPLSLVVQFTRLVQGKEFPLNPDDFQTSSKGQVAGLGGGNLKKILKEHGITQQLSAEGGRTSRGSMGLMIKYVDFLNSWNTEARGWKVLRIWECELKKSNSENLSNKLTKICL